MASVPCQPQVTLDATSWEYELVPLMPLPQVDLSISVKSRLIRSKTVHKLIRVFAQSPLTFPACLAFEASLIAVFFVRAPLGRTIGVIGTLLGLPSSIVAIGNMRFELLAVLIKTYDVVFCIVISTSSLGLVMATLRDTRSLLPWHSWLGFMLNIFVDASIQGGRAIWFGNIGAMACYVTIGVMLTMQVTDGLFLFNIIESNGRALPATAVVRDGLATMVIVILRNMYRNVDVALHEKQTTLSKTVTCVSLRCRLKLQRRGPDRQAVGPIKFLSESSQTKTRSQLRYVPSLGLIDSRQTIVNDNWLLRGDDTRIIHVVRRLAMLTVAVSFVISVVIGLVEFLRQHGLGATQTTVPTSFAIAAALCAAVFIGVCVSAMQRNLLWAIVTSFEFVFLASQITLVHLALADLVCWKPAIVLSLGPEWLWTMWLLTWDAITPHVRQQLGVTPRFTAGVGTILLVKATTTAVIIFFVLPPHTIHDRVLLQMHPFAQAVEVRVLSWYGSCSMTVFAGTLRLIWRLWWSSEAELVLLDGSVVYDTKRDNRRVPFPNTTIVPSPNGQSNGSRSECFGTSR